MAQGMLASGIAALGRKPLDAARGERREERFDALEIAVVWHPRRVDQDNHLAGLWGLGAGILARTALEPEAAAGQRTPLAQRSRLVSVRVLRWL